MCVLIYYSGIPLFLLDMSLKAAFSLHSVRHTPYASSSIHAHTYQSEGGTTQTAYSTPGRGDGVGWGQNRVVVVVRRALGWPPLF